MSPEDQRAADRWNAIQVSFSLTEGIHAAIPGGREAVTAFQGPAWVDLVANKDCSDIPQEEPQTMFN